MEPPAPPPSAPRVDVAGAVERRWPQALLADVVRARRGGAPHRWAGDAADSAFAAQRKKGTAPP